MKKKKAKSLTKNEKNALAYIDHEWEIVQQAVGYFYPNRTLADFSFSSEEYPLAKAYASEQEELSQERMTEECTRIRANVQDKKPNYIELRFNEAAQYFEGKKYPLGNTVTKLRAMDSGNASYLFAKEGDTFDAMVFIDGDNNLAFLAAKDKDGKDQLVRLSELHLLSYHKTDATKNEIGLLTSFVWPWGKIYSSVLCAINLFPVKNLLLSEFLQSEWKRIKDSAGQPASKIGGDAEHGQKT